MNKYIITAVLLTIMAFPAVSSAQVATDTVNLSDESKAALVAQIKAELADLYQQLITQLLAEIQSQSTAIATLNNKVDQVVTNTTKTDSASTTGSVGTVAPQVSVSVGQPYCPNNYKKPTVDVSISGNWNNGSIATEQYVEQNDVPQVDQPRESKSFQISKYTSYQGENILNKIDHVFQNVTASYPFKVVVDGNTLYDDYVNITECK